MDKEIKERISAINSGIIPEGYKKTKVGIVPVEWKVEHIGEHLQEYRELSNDIEKYPVYSSSRKGLIPQSDYYDQKEATQTNLGYKIVPVGYVTYRHMSDDDIFHFNLNTTGKSVLVSSEYPVFNAKSNANLYYIISCLNEMPRFRYFCRSQKLGGTRTRLYYKNLSMYQLSFPPLPEQQKIADILSTQDKLIELQEKKIEKLKELKKDYLQKMFPKKGSKYPEIRFKGFTDAWEQRKFGENFKCSQGLQVPVEEQLTEQIENTERFIRIIDVTQQGEPPRYVYNPTGKGRVKEKDLFFVRYGAVGTIGYGYNGVIANNLFKAEPLFEADIFFLFQQFSGTVFNDKLKEMSASTSMPAINFGALNNLLFYTTSYEEQSRIGMFFESIDTLITLHQRKSEQEKQKKKALMQLLLTGIVRTK